MFSLKTLLLSLPLLAATFLSSTTVSGALITRATDKNCQKYNILFTGFPPYHPLVTAQHPGDEAAAGLSEELKELVAAGYNTKELFFGPEEGMAPLERALKEKKWDGVVIGFGVRGAGALVPTIHFEKLVNTVKRGTDAKVPLMFNYNPWFTLEAVQRWLPLGDCAARQGTNYGAEIVCAVPKVCPQLYLQS